MFQLLFSRIPYEGLFTAPHTALLGGGPQARLAKRRCNVIRLRAPVTGIPNSTIIAIGNCCMVPISGLFNRAKMVPVPTARIKSAMENMWNPTKLARRTRST